ncbi:MAG TPA: recombinase, partial [Selenomonas sp.]|nr:recombinase [Selenomonas sp.]
AISYARKYALCNLFAIDDTKDPDTDEYRREAGNRYASQTSQNRAGA